jgi:hypothetical protein
MAGNGRVGHLAPLTPAVVDVGVADAAELDVDQDVTGTDVAALDGQRGERLAGGQGAVGLAVLVWGGGVCVVRLVMPTKKAPFAQN